MEQMRLGDDFLPELDTHETKKAVEKVFEQYHIYKYLVFEEREANTTSQLSDTPRSYTGTTSDQTGSIAVYNVDEKAKRKAYVDRVEKAVARLPKMERMLIEKRYLCDDAQYITDYHVYNFEFPRPMSQPKYAEIRWRAFYKLAFALDVQVKKGVENDGG